MQLVSECAAWLAGGLAELGVERCAMVGNSLGGCMAAVLAAQSPQRVSKLVLLSVALSEPKTMAEVVAFDRPRTGVIYDADDLPIPTAPEQTRKSFGMVDPRVHDELMLGRARAGAWVRSCERGVLFEGVGAFLSGVKAPTLLMYGTGGIYKRFEAASLARLADGRSVTIPDAGSFAHQDNPIGTAQALTSFLR
jgi:pimeloyl-ACP methyl ester carboxylesterase